MDLTLDNTKRILSCLAGLTIFNMSGLFALFFFVLGILKSSSILISVAILLKGCGVGLGLFIYKKGHKQMPPPPVPPTTRDTNEKEINKETREHPVIKEY